MLLDQPPGGFDFPDSGNMEVSMRQVTRGNVILPGISALQGSRRHTVEILTMRLLFPLWTILDSPVWGSLLMCQQQQCHQYRARKITARSSTDHLRGRQSMINVPLLLTPVRVIARQGSRLISICKALVAGNRNVRMPYIGRNTVLLDVCLYAKRRWGFLLIVQDEELCDAFHLWTSAKI